MIPVNALDRAPDINELLADIERVVRSGRYVLGAELNAFEVDFADYVGVCDAVGVASGTDALELALHSVGVAPGQGDVVGMAANAGMYAAAATVRLGARPVWVDVDDAGALTASALEVALRHTRLSAVVVTHLYGRMGDIAAISQLCRDYEVPLIEDCAQSVGAQVGGRQAGAWGTAAAFSFYPTKNLGALGDGGAVTSSRPDVAERVRSLRQYGWSQRYIAESPGGCNSRLHEIQAAVLRRRLKTLNQCNRRRRAIMQRYLEALPPGYRLPFADDGSHVGHLAVIVCPTGEDRDQLRQSMLVSGISTDVHYPVPDHRQVAMRRFADGVVLPVTEELAERVVTLPCFPGLTDDEVTAVVAALRQTPGDGGSGSTPRAANP